MTHQSTKSQMHPVTALLLIGSLLILGMMAWEAHFTECRTLLPDASVFYCLFR